MSCICSVLGCGSESGEMFRFIFQIYSGSHRKNASEEEARMGAYLQAVKGAQVRNDDNLDQDSGRRNGEKVSFMNIEEAKLKIHSHTRILACKGERGAESKLRSLPKQIDEEEAIAWNRTHRS